MFWIGTFMLSFKLVTETKIVKFHQLFEIIEKRGPDEGGEKINASASNL